jgi:hypothetical protein
MSGIMHSVVALALSSLALYPATVHSSYAYYQANIISCTDINALLDSSAEM